MNHTPPPDGAMPEPVRIGSESRTTFNGQRWILDGEVSNRPGKRCHTCKKPNYGASVYPSKSKADPNALTLWTCHACAERLYGSFSTLNQGWGDDESAF